MGCISFNFTPDSKAWRGSVFLFLIFGSTSIDYQFHCCLHRTMNFEDIFHLLTAIDNSRGLMCMQKAAGYTKQQTTPETTRRPLHACILQTQQHTEHTEHQGRPGLDQPRPSTQPQRMPASTYPRPPTPWKISEPRNHSLAHAPPSTTQESLDSDQVCHALLRFKKKLDDAPGML